ncbi:MAG: hypothetical protein HOV80_25260 [Polyangiaceae bacterium]|nr:hypothetical protein [Polyangiaceae bacterium]
MRARSIALLSIVAAACAPAPPRSEGRAVALVVLPEATPPATSARASASASAAAEPSAPARFVPDLPPTGLPTEFFAGSSPCRVDDHLLGTADDVVRDDGVVFPVSMAFGPRGGLATWQHHKKTVVRPIDQAGAPVGPAVTIDHARAPAMVPVADHFVLAWIDDDTVTFRRVLSTGEARGTARVKLPLPPYGGIGQFLSHGRRAAAVFYERGGPPTGFSPRVAIVDVEFTSDGDSHSTARIIETQSPIFGADEWVAGTYAGERALLLGRSSGKAFAITPTGIKEDPVEIRPQPARHVRVIPHAIGEPGPSRYATQLHDDFTGFEGISIPGEVAHPPEERFRVEDKRWMGLSQVHYTGQRFVMGRLSGPAKKVDARVFSVACPIAVPIPRNDGE